MNNSSSQICVLSLSLFTTFTLTANVPGYSKEKPGRTTNDSSPRTKANTTGACSSILIQAPPEIVWLTVHEERQNAPDLAYSKVISQSENEAQIEQKFKFWSGGAKCLMNQKEIPNERIDYKLVKSDHLKELRGSWVFTPSADGKQTTLELSTLIDYGFLVPRGIATALTTKVIERRLAHVKKMAELHREELDVKGRVLSANK